MAVVCTVGGSRARSIVLRGVGRYPRVLASMATPATRALRPWCWAQRRLLVPLEVLASLTLFATTVGAKAT